MLALSLIVVACGGSGGGAKSAPATDLLGKKNPATGAPVTLGFISSSASDNVLSAQFKRIEQGLQMSLRYANDYRAGIAGHPLRLFICQGGETPAGEQDCANQMVNHNVAAVITPFTASGSSVVPIITAAKIPYVALSGTSSEELTRPGAFSLTGAFPSSLAGFAAYARDHHVKKFAMLATDAAAVIQAVNSLGVLVFKNAGVGFQVIPVPAGTADMTPNLQAAVKGGADAIGMVGDLTFCTSFLQAYQTLGLNMPKYLINTCIDPTTIKTYGTLINGSVMGGTSSTDRQAPDAKLYGAIARTYDKSVNPDPGVSASQSSGVITLLSFVNAFKNFTGDPSPAAILNQLRTAKDTPMFLGGGATFTCDGKALPLLPDVCSSAVQIGTVDASGQIKGAQLIKTTPLFKV